MRMRDRILMAALTLAMLGIVSPGVAAGADATSDRFEVTDLAEWRAGSDAVDLTQVAEWRGELTGAEPAPSLDEVAPQATAPAAPASPLLWTLVGVVLGAVAALGVASRRPQRAVAG